ncbi:MAG: ABC transporter ATP-binding protein [Methylococcaceae bacterium]|jgi:NitT/TauT family transport system ATP-binding protein
MTALRIQHLKKDHGRGLVIDDLNLTVDSGEFVCLVGPSGCGKTTLLQLIAGLDRHYSGDIEISQRDPKALRIGYASQEPRLLPWRTVRDNLSLALPAGMDPARINALIDTVGLDAVADEFPETLSVGMSRRVSLVRAFAIDPDLLLMDEPLVSLDAPTARRLRSWLLGLWQKRPHTVLFVTHDLREAIEIADRILFLSAAPLKVLADIRVTIERQNRNPEAIETFSAHLRTCHPNLDALL